MMEKSFAQKARLKPGTTIAVLNAVPAVVESLDLPDDVEFVEPSDAKLLFLFASTRAELEAQMPPLAALLGADSAMWVFFRKGSKAAGLDMNRDTIWAIAERLGMRPIGLLSVDETWSAFRLKAVSVVGEVR